MASADLGPSGPCMINSRLGRPPIEKIGGLAGLAVEVCFGEKVYLPCVATSVKNQRVDACFAPGDGKVVLGQFGISSCCVAQRHRYFSLPAPLDAGWLLHARKIAVPGYYTVCVQRLSKNRMSKIYIYPHLAGFLRAVIDYTRTGYLRYTYGIISLDKSQRLNDKFAVLYRSDADRNHRYRLKQKGISPTVLLFRRIDDELVQWLLLVHSEGESVAARCESLHWINNNKSRLNVAGFELIRRQDTGKHNPNDKGKLRWTWRMDKALESAIRGRIIESIRQHDDRELARIQKELWAMPGFAGVRVQIGKATALARSEWTRSRSTPWGEWPKFLPYITRKG